LFINDNYICSYTDKKATLFNCYFCREIFKDGLEQCKTSAEFLLNPWVLMQLPWQPVLLLQWVAGVVTEIYSLRLELIELYRWRLPIGATRAVKKLFKMVAHMPVLVFQAMSHLKSHFYVTSVCYKSAVIFLNLLTHEILPLLELVVSGQLRDIVRALKRLSFGTNFHLRESNLFAKYVDYEWENAYNCLFSNHFWHIGDANDLMGTFPLLTVPRQDQTDMSEFSTNLAGGDAFVFKANAQWIVEMSIKYGEKIETEKV
jgi:hypothetical protein